jgi:hypothetical protein
MLRVFAMVDPPDQLSSAKMVRDAVCSELVSGVVSLILGN